ncbi:MAG: DUF29 domain-containing protein [Synechococcales bacterium]|nr:DUF29 domain-containing protein [Synechococcales bacterium]
MEDVIGSVFEVANPIALPLYERDFHAWAIEQAALLRDRQWQSLDWDHLSEELQALGRQQRQELVNRLSILLGHLLKWQYQPQARSRSWLATIRIQRRELTRLLQSNPSLQPFLEEALQYGYANGRDLAMGETNLPEATFPLELAYSMEFVFDPASYPGEPAIDLLT